MNKFLIIIFYIISVCNSYGSTYYVKAAGNDNQDGNSIATAWKTLDAVRAKNFGPGDIILLEGGTVFNGYIFFDKDDLADPANPITISSYGTGKATINSGANYGLYLYNTAAFKIVNISLQGSGTSTNFENGLQIFCDKANTHLDYLFVDNVNISGYGKSGILIEGKNYNAGFKNITVVNSNLYNNGIAGIRTKGDSINLTTVYAHQNIYIANNKVYNNKGIDFAYDVTGSGIELSSVNGATIEYNEVYNNGELSNSPIGGPIGIWVFDVNNATIQHNESHHNKTGGERDGGGFDLDGGTTNSVMQYNYSHDNDGSGYLLAIHKNKNPLKGNTIRYNISQNDGRKNGYASVYLWAFSSSTGIENLQFYNNTIYLSPPASGNPSLMRIDGPMSNVFFRNNIFYTTEWIYQMSSLENSGITFQGNCYYSSGSFNIWWNGTTYSSLASWRTVTGQEKNGSVSTGLQTDPQLNSPGTAGTVHSMNQLTTISQYKLKSTSPLINAGLSLSQFGINSGNRDYFGYSIKQGAEFEIGAHEFGVAGTNTELSVNMTSPITGTTISNGSSLVLTAHAAAGNASITKMEFYRGTTLLGTSSSWPYKITLSNLSAGSYSITAKAFNSAGASKSSSSISFTVSAPVSTLKNPENPANTVNGLDYSYYEGTWTQLPDFNSLTPIETGSTSNFNLSERNRDDNFGFRFTGYVTIPTDGIYTFYALSNEGSKLFIGNTELINNDGIHDNTEKSGNIGLKAGKHAITVIYFEATGSEALTISYSSSNISKVIIPSSSLFRVSDAGITCASSGKILREVWNNVSGNTVIDLIEDSDYPNAPSSSTLLTIFEGPLNAGNNYGARYRGYLCAPATGYYTFWIASDNDSELWLSNNDNPANKIKIAFVDGYTTSRDWQKYPTQKSSGIFLNKGRYYVEVLHKEGVGEDNLAIGWQLPNGTLERPIPGSRLTAYGETINNPPQVSISSPSNGASFVAPASISINANASDSDGNVSKVEFYQGTTLLGTDSNSPFSFNWTNVGSGNYSLTAKAYDNDGASKLSEAVSITVNDPGTGCTASGTILREFWSNVTGNTVSSIPVNTTPTSTNELSLFEGPSNAGTNYGARYRGYVCVPLTGNYTFWIASNDDSELWLSIDDNPDNKVKIAHVTGYTSSRQWEKYASQKSSAINLVSGKRYYIEALHKQNAGTDNLAVGWQLPNGTLERPIPGMRLSPFGSGNTPPAINISSPSDGATFIAPATITINATASDSDGTIAKVEFYQGSAKLGEDVTSPYSFTWTNVATGNYALTAKAIDNGNASATSGIVNITVSSSSVCNASGTIVREFWNGVAGNEVSEIPTSLPPTSTSQLTIFEGPTNIGTNYGARYRGYICAPATGNYIFWIASNDHSELWLSTNNNPDNKAKIAYVTGATASREWTKFSSQQSLPVNLVAGQNYYIEALHKQGAGTDHLAVGWQIPGGTQERPIPGNRLSPYTAAQASSVSPIFLIAQKEAALTPDDSIHVSVYPNPATKGFITLAVEGYEKTKHKVHIEILDMQGKFAYSDKIPCEITCRRTIINIDEKFKNGLYVVNVSIDGKLFSEKLLIE